jgi:hypothetical protein
MASISTYNFICVYWSSGKQRILLLLFLLIFTDLYSQKLTDTSVVVQINGEVINFREFNLFAQKERASVIQYYRVNYGMEYTQEFWIKAYNGVTPTEYLKKQTIDALKMTVLQQAEAKKQGLIDNIGYANFLINFEKENKRRLEARSKGQVIYGPVQYSEEGYFDYLFSNLVNKLKNDLYAKEFLIDKSLQLFYDLNRSRFCNRGFNTKIRVEILIPKNTELVNSDVSLSDNFRQLSFGVSDTLNPTKVIEKQNSSYLYRVQDFIFNDTIRASEEVERSIEMINGVANRLNAGQTSGIINFHNSYYKVKVVDRQSLGFSDLRECRNIQNFYLDSLYNRYLQNLASKAIVEVNREVYDRINF